MSSFDLTIVNPLTVRASIETKLQSRKDDPINHYWLYALKLQDDKYYVGLTASKNPYTRIDAHYKSKGACWTKQHHPIETVEIRDLGIKSKGVAERMEYKLTLVYMDVYGYQKVRGGIVTYTGRIHKFGPLITWGLQFEALCTVMFLMLAVLILIFTH